MRIHFIAIGGSAMHSLAIALQGMGHRVTGSDDEIFEPSLSRLRGHGLLPEAMGWDPERITPALEAVVLGMHARADNPELHRARALGVRIYSYPEYLYQQALGKTRVVIGGSHGKTTITAMVMHVLRHSGRVFDYMVGAPVHGFDAMVRLSADAPIAVFEGDEYLTSPIDPRPKFHLYRPHIALLSGIAWDHVNAFPTWESYREQFGRFVQTIEPGGTLVYCAEDPEVVGVSRLAPPGVSTQGYSRHPSVPQAEGVALATGQGAVPLQVIGAHNLQNIAGAKAVCGRLGVTDAQFYSAISTFRGAARRLQLLAENSTTRVFYDFAHSPSKVLATVRALREAYPGRRLVACLELHTFSSLNPQFLNQYKGSLAKAHDGLVFFNPKTLEHKGLPPITPHLVQQSFGHPRPLVFVHPPDVQEYLLRLDWAEAHLLLMTSGSFAGVDLPALARTIAPSG